MEEDGSAPPAKPGQEEEFLPPPEKKEEETIDHLNEVEETDDAISSSGGNVGQAVMRENKTTEGEEEGSGQLEGAGERGIPKKMVEMEEVVRRIGLVELKRPEAEVVAVVERLVGANWVTTLDQWRALTPATKRELRLPLMLVHHLDALPTNHLTPRTDGGDHPLSGQEEGTSLYCLKNNKM